VKHLYLVTFFVILALSGRSQCDSPLILDWSPTGAGIYTVQFDAPSGGNYILDVALQYHEGGETQFIGDAAEGINEIQVDVAEIVNFGFAENYYFTCHLSIECDSGGQSEETEFYLSEFSLTAEEGFNCDGFFTPLQFFSDGSAFMYETVVSVPASNDLVETVSVFVDLGHEYNGDLSIELEHPSGVTISLLAYPSQLGNTTGFSVIFSDQASGFPVVGGGGQSSGPRGVFLPSEPLEILSGMPTQGDWTLRIMDNLGVDFGYVFGYCISINGIPCESSVQGTTFFDLNANSVQDGNEPSYPFANILNSITNEEFYSLEDGNYWNCSSPGNGFLEVLNPPTYYAANPLEIDLESDDQLANLSIPLSPTDEVADVCVDLSSLQPNRPGFEASYGVFVSNYGTICQENVAVEIQFPDYVEIIGSTNENLLIDGNTATMEIEEVCPFDPVEFYIAILIDDTVSLGTNLQASITASPEEEDAHPFNNTFTSSVTVVGSYDPNDKQASESIIGDEFLENGSPLKYTIRFQNTGTFYAERVVIVDTIDFDLDVNSLNIVSTSHDMQLSREGNVLTFEFDQIFLPDSTTDFEGSIGHVRYEIDPLPTFSEGDLIKNTAYIYFDFNEPIVTNTVVTAFGNPLSTSEEGIETSLYPNPTHDRIIASWNSDFNPERVEVFDLTGRMVKEEITQGTNLLELNVSDLPQGLYLIRFIANDAVSENKFVKD